MNVPNTLTLLRIFFVPLLVAVLLGHSPNVVLWGFPVHFEMWGVLILAAAAATDWLDGMIARRRGEVTTLGILLDPIADKLLISAALISLVQVHAVPGWMVILIVGREFANSGLRSIAAAEGYTIKASDLGKTKMVAQVTAISFLLISIRYRSLASPAYWMMWVVVVFAMTSAIGYFRKFWRKVDVRIKTRRRRELLRVERRRKLAALRQGRSLVETGSVGAVESSEVRGVRGTT